jgi:hypothetical protein
MNTDQELTDTGRFSMKRSNKKGSFYHRLPVYQFSKDEQTVTTSKSFKDYRIDPLNEDELKEGWIRVLPKSLLLKNRDFNNNVKVSSSNKKFKRIKKYYTFELTLLDLPNNLFKNLRRNYKNGNFLNYTVNNRIFRYKVIPTGFDDDVFELRRLINIKSNKYDKNKISQIVCKLKDENLSGWILSKAEDILSK